MNRTTPFLTIIAAGIALSLAATPIFAQRSGGRPSSKCVQEIMKLCGRDRSQIPACLQSKASSLSSGCQKEIAKRMGISGPQQAGAGTFQPTRKPSHAILYGTHQRQQIDVYEPSDAVDDLPLVLFIHGGAWQMGSHKRVQSKPTHFNRNSIFFASAGYRVLPEASVEEQAKDLGLALQALVGQAGIIGFDKQKVVLMGHSAGAHLAALLATDPQYAGEAFGSIKGVVLLDGAGYDVPANIEIAQFQARQLYLDVFGDDVEGQKKLSPVTHVGGPDAPNWLALYVEQRAPAKLQAEALVAGLTNAGHSAKAIPIAETDHGRMNREIGMEAGTAQTEAIDTFLAEMFK